MIFSHGEKHFSAGLDLAEALANRNRDEGDRPRRRRSKWHNTFDAISRSEIPWIAALKGATIGGGLELACAIATNAPLTNWAIVTALPRIGEAPTTTACSWRA